MKAVNKEREAIRWLPLGNYGQLVENLTDQEVSQS